ncbi:MAG TPA: type II toxin-antitoxin system VapC family toxin [Caulobacteraceae bacterium]|jgi:PIN domain nuclease of toxin-antitoxin system|nr:type II toxin-antitoxin system VapC family toxin [Caulobacteraceae bacterium]
MKLLLDTHLLLWAVSRPERLSPATKRLLEDPGNTLVFSVASLWELAIKHALGRSDLILEPRLLRRALLDNGYEELMIVGDHAVSVGTLPHLHKDPFDRLLVAQAMVEGITLLTSDARLAEYPGPIRRV